MAGTVSVISAEAAQPGPRLPDRLHHRLRRHVPAQVNDAIAVVLQHRPDDVLADVVDVALDGGDDDGLSVGHAALGGQHLPHHVAGGLGRVGGAHELGQEQRPRLVPAAHLVQDGDDGLVDQLLGLHLPEHLLRRRAAPSARPASTASVRGSALFFSFSAAPDADAAAATATGAVVPAKRST